jgi:hypothetical protein
MISAIAGVARASDRVPLDDGLSLGRNGGRSEYEEGKRTCKITIHRSPHGMI